MTHSPKSSEPDAVRQFLRQYAPEAPAAAAEMEDRLMRAIEALPPEPIAAKRGQPWWVIPTAIVASMGLLWGGNRVFQVAQRPAVDTSTEVASLETFLEDSWGSVAYGSNTSSSDSWSLTAWLDSGVDAL